jgi:hypothetical protein
MKKERIRHQIWLLNHIWCFIEVGFRSWVRGERRFGVDYSRYQKSIHLRFHRFSQIRITDQESREMRRCYCLIRLIMQAIRNKLTKAPGPHKLVEKSMDIWTF